MRSIGNGDPQVCVQNILNIVRGQAPYLRDMGLDGSLYDKPIEEVKPLAIADAEEQIETYEERVSINEIDVIETKDHNLKIVPDITVLEN
nr:MAG TPA: Regulator of RpoS, Anti-adapter protein regulator, ClpXP adaptor, anti-adaptor.0A [Caudoviricetes sp.]